MPVKYVLLEKGNPGKPEEQKKWYASTKNTGEITLKALKKEIIKRTTVNYTDILAVLESLKQVLCEQLKEGKIVRLGDFGSFQVRIESEGAERKEKYTIPLIKSKKVVFRPGAGLKEMLNDLEFEIVD
ncbi:MAG: HU family DNA-binding protein [Dysgonamonadaceae bacterium]|jgi:predicted histone-like DNA-binding protein|nr:HU family DNA-binding protein [Dysgonamonadaceae bacterium]